MRTIVEITFGSHLYGTSTPTSDVDYKSVFVPPARDILLQSCRASVSNQRPKQPFEKNVAGEIDHEAFALHRFLGLLAEGQIMACDMLFAPRSAMRGEPAAIWQEITSHHHRLLSRHASSFVAYCRTQANKYGIKGSRVHAARSIVEWFDQAIATHGHLAKLATAIDTLPAFITERQLAHTALVDIPQPDGRAPVPHLQCCDRKAPIFASLKDSRAIYARILDAYGARALMTERNEGIDWKALSHAVRVGHEALELLATAWITFPLANAAHLLAIKRGELPYAAVAEEIEALLVRVEAAQATSILPESPDLGLIDDLIEQAYREAIVG